MTTYKPNHYSRTYIHHTKRFQPPFHIFCVGQYFLKQYKPAIHTPASSYTATDIVGLCLHIKPNRPVNSIEIMFVPTYRRPNKPFNSIGDMVCYSK